LNFKYSYGRNKPGRWRNLTQGDTGLLRIRRQGSNNYTRDAKTVQDLLPKYFTSPEGEVPWQHAHVRTSVKMKNKNDIMK
jgi:hypothetical protein